MSLLDDYPKIAQVDDLDTYLGLNGQIDVARAQLLLALAEARCAMVLDPLPVAALPIVLDIAQRAYTNVTGASAQAVGSASVQLPSIGVSLTSANRRELRMLGGRAGAFTVDPTPADAGQGLPVWGQNVTWLNGVPGVSD